MKFSKKIVLNFLSTFTLLIFLVFTFLDFNDSSEPLTSKNNEEIANLNLQNINSCEVGKYSFLIENFGKKSDYSIKYQAKDLEIFPEFNNLFCLGKINYVEIVNNEIIVFLGTNRYLFNILNLALNLTLIFLVFKDLIPSDKSSFILYLSLNFINFNLFNSHISILKIIFPAAEPQTNDQNYFINFLFIALFLLKNKNKNKNKIIAFIYILVFLIPDYLGLFAIMILAKKDNTLKLNTKTQENLILAIPLIFYVSRIIYSLSSYFDTLWMYSGQRIYHGISRYYDLVWNFESMACIKNPNYFINYPNKICRELYGGFLDDYIYITTDPYKTAILSMIVTQISLCVIFLKLVKSYPNQLLLLSFLFISPALNFLTFQGNIDLIYMIVIFYLLNNSKKVNILNSTVLFVFSLYKIHLIGGIFGLVVFAFKNRDKKIGIFNSILLLISSYFAIDLFLNNAIVSNFGQLEISYGLLFIAQVVSEFTKFNSYLVFLILIILLILMYKINFLKIKSMNLYHYPNFSLYEYVLLFWLGFTLLIVNNSYRLPIFLILIFKFLNSDNYIFKIIFLLFTFLSVTPSTYNFLEVFLYSIKHLTNFIITYIIFVFILKEFGTIIKNYFKKVSI